MLPGEAMPHDHRRILATGMARLRAKIKYRPVVFELMPPEFTLLQLQQTVEALAGRGLHKQNFRRSEEHTSELQSRQYLVCRLLLEKKKKNKKRISRDRSRSSTL